MIESLSEGYEFNANQLKKRLKTLRINENILRVCVGGSMHPLVELGEIEVLSSLINNNGIYEGIEVGDIVVAEVGRRLFVHLLYEITSVNKTMRFLIGNNHGHINGYAHKLLGIVVGIQHKSGDVEPIERRKKEIGWKLPTIISGPGSSQANINND